MFNTRKIPLSRQFLISLTLVFSITLGCYYAEDFIGYRIVALILLMVVSLIAMMFEIWPVIVSAVLSAFIWNFFFIPPLFTFHIGNTEDNLMFLLYFVISLVNVVLTFKIRDAEKKARDKEEKENTIRLYNTLLNSLSHELRTPISAIIAAVDMIKENGEKLSSTHQSELLSEIDKASIRLNRQVENLLNMSRLESGILKPKIDWCDLNELVHSVILKLTPTVQHQIEFIPDEALPFFKLDKGLIEQVIYNLLHNAVHHTPENTKVKIEVMHLDNHCCIKVHDFGKGFPEKEIALVFDKFYRMPHTKIGGSGLGLSIVKGFVEAHQGKVTLNNHPEGGAVFTIEIPADTSFINNLKNE
ncbi:MAG: DUF4118 domain-containing protein [Saprospiraceae bacterium]|nr:DUF4118 domain-containing protein [Saprospiraceae bacterium]